MGCSAYSSLKETANIMLNGNVQRAAISYPFKEGDIIQYRKVFYRICKVDIEINPHGIDVGYTNLRRINLQGNFSGTSRDLKEMNQILEYNLKHGQGFLVNKEIFYVLYI